MLYSCLPKAAFLTICLGFVIAENEANQSQQNVSGEVCSLDPEVGPCKAHRTQWYYNATIDECSSFTYGGCKGNDNNFDSKEECLQKCSPGYTLPNHLPAETPKPQKLKTDEQESKYKAEEAQDKTAAETLPLTSRGAELTFVENSDQKVFMFSHSNSYIQLDASEIPSFQLRHSREIRLQFRTRQPHGLLVYHSIKDRPADMEPYALYIMVEKGQLKVVHVFGTDSTHVIVGKGLNRDKWHNVRVTINAQNGTLVASLDDREPVEVLLKGIDKNPHYGISGNHSSVILIGGLSSEEKVHGVKYIIGSFVGCIKDVTLSAGEDVSSLAEINPLVASHYNVQEGCLNKCRTIEDLCFVGSTCINHYNKITCNCFGSPNEGKHCDVYTDTILTLRGYSYVSYRVYDWKDRVHSNVNAISFQFKTFFNDSILFYASGEHERHHYIAASIAGGVIYFEANFGDGTLNATIGRALTANFWHTFQIIHHGKDLKIELDNVVMHLEIPGNHHHLYIDPEIYFGGVPDHHKTRGLVTRNNFVGSLKKVFFNDFSIIYELKEDNPKVHFISRLAPELYERTVDVIPLTFPFPHSYVVWPLESKESFSIKFDFKSSGSTGVLAASNANGQSGITEWELILIGDVVTFEGGSNMVKVSFNVNSGAWHTVELEYKNGVLKLVVDYRKIKKEMLAEPLQLGDSVEFGGSSKTKEGLVGCLRDIIVNGHLIEARSVVKTDRAVGEIALDNCQLVDPCLRPNTCKHGGKCSVRNREVVCDCSETGYTGKNCHFALHRKTCEELALLGHNKGDVYLIDIDGNGPFPPASVRCEFSPEGATKTIVEHNLPSQVDVRKNDFSSFYFDIRYREFTPEMLQELISHSLYCQQHIKYECNKAPLELHSKTWFLSSSGESINFIGSFGKGRCPCAVNRTCADTKKVCNCDSAADKWLSDEGYYRTSDSLGITQMYFIQEEGLDHDALGRITLSPLECVEANTQKYVVTFISNRSYIEVPGWRTGDIAFSFRTTATKAILLYQPPIRPNHPFFVVALTSDHTLTLNFTISGKTRELEIRSHRQLNNGEWQQIWIDYNEHHVRFMINTEHQMIDLEPDEQFGPFEGSMFIGGAPEELLAKIDIVEGLIGCFRGLVVNGEVLDIYSYMSVHLSEILMDCKPSCDPNPCKNGAKCKELWHTFECECENPWAHVGNTCGTNINENGITFLTPESHIKSFYVQGDTDKYKGTLKNSLSQDILVNLRTYDTNSLIFVASDHLNNFVQLHIEDGQFLIFTFNSRNEIKDVSVEYPDLNKGKSIQIAIRREPSRTTLHVNDRSNSTQANLELLTWYSAIPWTDTFGKELLPPPRPLAPPSEYFQISLGGYSDELSPRRNITGYVGCIRGLKIGDNLLDLPAITDEMTIRETKVVVGCKMVCDDVPCKHQGFCIEDFENEKFTCNCERTSYYGEHCDEEKGAHFGGDSAILRRYELLDDVSEIRTQLAFSSDEVKNVDTALLLIQTDNSRTYYLLVAILNNGHLLFQEDREDYLYEAIISDENFFNGARHSLLYERVGNESMLLVDREVVNFTKVVRSPVREEPTSEGNDQVQIGGVLTNDLRLKKYSSYKGCLSNIFVKINKDPVMKPLEEYMQYKIADKDAIQAINSLGIGSAKCSTFDTILDSKPGLPADGSVGKEKNWRKDPPVRVTIHYEKDADDEDDNRLEVVCLTLAGVFVLIVLGAIFQLYRANKAYQRRKEAEIEEQILWSKGQPVKYQDPILMPAIKLTSYKNTPEIKMRDGENGTELKPLTKNEYKHELNAPPADMIDLNNVNEKNEKERLHDNAEPELEWDPSAENTELLPKEPAEETQLPNSIDAEKPLKDDLDDTKRMEQIPVE